MQGFIRLVVCLRGVVGTLILGSMSWGTGLQMVAVGAEGSSVVTKPTDQEVVVYSSRKDHLIKPVFDAFTTKTGIKVKFITDSEATLIQKLKGEGPKTPADLFLTVDAGNLWQAAEEGILQPIESKVLEENIPANLQDPKNRWFGLSVRARTIAYNPTKVKADELSTYENLADPQWKKRLCLRTSQKVYNQSLVAMLIEELGAAKTRQVVEGWVANLATKVFSSDTKLLEAIAAGQCDVGIVNTYYFGRLKRDQPEIPLALFWPNQESFGVHVNISGAGVTRHAGNPDGAIKLLEWLSSSAAQSLFAGANLEYPASNKVKADGAVAARGDFKRNLINVSKVGALQADAIKLMDRAGYR